MNDEQRPPAGTEAAEAASPLPPSGDEAERAPESDEGKTTAPAATWPLWLALVVLAAATIGGGAFLYHTVETGEQRLGSELATAQEDLDGLAVALEEALEETRAARQSALEQARAAQQSAREAADAQAGFSERLGDMAERLDAFATRQEGITEGLERLGALADAHEETWIRSEAGYLAQVAAHRVRFHRDIDSALAALQGADELLSRLGGRGIGARQAVGAAIDALLAYSPPNTARIDRDLDALVDGLDHWALRADRRDAEEVEMPWTGAREGWRGLADRAWTRLREGLGALVTIHREDELEPYLPPDRRYFLRENLRLQLEGARMALLLEDQEKYRAGLERAEGWLARHFDTEDPDVDAARATLRKLAAKPIVVTPPDIGPVLEPLKPF